MEQFVVSARKYRPARFEDVVGQAHVTETLRRAIEQNHLAQALLFTGPRGVGKTTCARILARMINADNAQADQDYAFNIFELDAASNNGVDDIRSLTDQVRYPPQSGKFKVYIIDEVHMLSTAAFNAFLKTLEEPPAHAIFILATTEKHKLIPTILSRCQIYDFRRIGVDDIASHLAEVAQKEGVEAESSALHLIAQKADGALRDALSIFDRIATYSGSRMRYPDVVQNLQLLDHDFFFKTVEHMQSGDSKAVLLLLDRIIALGFDSHQFLLGLAAHFRDLLVAKDPATAGLIELGAELKERYRVQAASLDWRVLMEGLDRLGEADGRYRNSSHKRLLTELGLLKLTELVGQKKNESGGLTESVPAPTPLPASAPALAQPQAQPQALAQAQDSASFEKKTETRSPSPPAESAAPGETASPAPFAQSSASPPAAMASEPTAPPAPQPLRQPETPRSTDEAGGAERRKSSRFGYSLQPAAPVSETPVQEDVEEAFEPAPSFDLERIQRIWADFAHAQNDTKPTLSAALLSRKPLKDPETGHVLFTVPSKLSEQLLREHQAALMAYVRECSGLEKLRLIARVEEGEAEQRPYSPDEVYAHLSARFPELARLRTDLDLDL